MAEKKRKYGCLLVGGIVVVAMLAYMWHVGRTDPRAQKMPDKCLSAWDGSHEELVKRTKEGMGDPSSFKHVETRYIDRGDEIDLIMTYTGRNAFGGTVKGRVSAIIDRNCNLIKGPISL